MADKPIEKSGKGKKVAKKPADKSEKGGDKREKIQDKSEKARNKSEKTQNKKEAAVLEKEKKLKTKRKAKKSHLEDHISDEEDAQPEPPRKHAETGSKRKSQVQDPETPSRATKKAKTSNAAEQLKVQLSFRPRHNVTPGPSRIPGQTRPGDAPTAPRAARDNMAPPTIGGRAGADIQVPRRPQAPRYGQNTPFRHYQPMFPQSQQSDVLPSVEYSPHQHVHHAQVTNIAPQDIKTALHPPTHQIQRLLARDTTAKQNHPKLQQTAREPAPCDTPYSEPGGEKEYRCGDCGKMFKVSKNPKGGTCLPWHPGRFHTPSLQLNFQPFTYTY